MFWIAEIPLISTPILLFLIWFPVVPLYLINTPVESPEITLFSIILLDAVESILIPSPNILPVGNCWVPEVSVPIKLYKTVLSSELSSIIPVLIFEIVFSLPEFVFPIVFWEELFMYIPVVLGWFPSWIVVSTPTIFVVATPILLPSTLMFDDWYKPIDEVLSLEKVLPWFCVLSPPILRPVELVQFTTKTP